MSSSGESSPCRLSPAAVPQVCRPDGPTIDPEPERPERMRDWLIRMINSGRFPGLEWLDEDKTIFRVPWIHAKKRGYCRERDAALFREWALHSGKYRDESDPTVWKINFRCAINGLKDIMEIKDMQSEDCRVYKVLPSRSRRRRTRRRPSTEPYTVPSSYPHGPEVGHIFSPSHYSTGSSIYPPPPPPQIVGSSQCQYSATMKGMEYRPPCMPILPTYSSVGPASSVVDVSQSGSCILSTGHGISSTGISVSDGHISELETPTGYFDSLPPPLPPVSAIQSGVGDLSHLTIRRQDSPDSGIEAQNSPLGHQRQSFISTSSCDMSLPPCSIPASSSSVILNHNSEIVQLVEELESTHSPTPSLPPSPSSNAIEVCILYGSIPVCNKNVICNNGCRVLHDSRYGHPSFASENIKARKLFGPPEAKQIQLPHGHPNPLASNIFEAMTRGLLIEMIDNDLYATPLCRTVVYYGSSANTQSYALEKEQRTKVFDFNQFRMQLEQYSIVPGQVPNPSVMFSLGQSWGPGRHVSQNLISIMVTHLQAKHELDSFGLPQALAQDLLINIPETVEIGKASPSDLEAEAFLSQSQYIAVN